MGRSKRKIERRFKIFNKRELSEHFDIHVNTLTRRMRAYGEVNLKNRYSVLKFLEWYFREYPQEG